MTRARGALERVSAGQAQNGICIARHEDVRSGGDIALPAGDYLIGLALGVAFRAVGGVQPDLQRDRLDELKLEQAGEIERLLHARPVGQCLRRVDFLPVEGAQKTGVGIGDYAGHLGFAGFKRTHLIHLRLRENLVAPDAQASCLVFRLWRELSLGRGTRARDPRQWLRVLGDEHFLTPGKPGLDFGKVIAQFADGGGFHKKSPC